MKFLKDLGILFYLVNPYESLLKDPKDMPTPDWLTRSIPYMYGSIILEVLVSYLIGKKQRPRLNDGINSLTHGIFLLIRTSLLKGVTNIPYFYIYEHYRVYSLPWDSIWTWFFTMIAIDFCYYWVHRASHEVGILWSAHQVHHSSEDYVLSTALRQSVFQEFGALFFYLPMAFFVPPSHKLVHDQFNLVYQFWIHTELIKNLGPLNYIFNTPKHHMVHHGANRYCLDKNYAGFLIIWDRMFGTFEELRPDEEIVYGLVDHPQFFNPIKHQVFYYKLLWDKAKSMNNWKDRLYSFIKGPGWYPGTAWTGDMSCVPEIPARKKYNPELSFFVKSYVLVHFILTSYIVETFQTEQGDINQSVYFGIILLIMVSLTNFGFICDKDSRAWIFETFRCCSFILVYNRFGRNYIEGMPKFRLFPRNLVNVFFMSSAIISIFAHFKNIIQDKKKKIQ